MLAKLQDNILVDGRRHLLAAIAAALMVAGNAWSEEEALMTGPELQAGSVALMRFRSDEPGSDIANFKVSLTEHAEEFEVIFIPNQPPNQTRIVMGGANVYGRVVHYFITKNTYEVSRRSFAR
jgi:hypothetical protein